jgi:hydroxymethylpyrimidine/phosphomethylpyrimidine kinase
MKSALTIAGSDPTGGAGLQADLKVFRSFGLYGLSVLSVLTAQNTEGVDSILPVDPDFFLKQIRSLLSDITPDAVKVGMIYSRAAVESLGRFFESVPPKNLVIDPVFISSSGVRLVEHGTLASLRQRLFPLSMIVTPNIREASELTGIRINDIQGMKDAARAVKDMGPDIVIITGGHLQDKALDLYYDGSFQTMETKKQQGQFHGTGCAFSASLCALLALGQSPTESFRKAKDFVHSAIVKAGHPGRGMGLLNL